MKLEDGRLRLSATDVANHLACRHVTTLDRGSAEGRWKPPHWSRPEAEVLAQRGLEHERAYLAHLERQGRAVTRLDDEEAGASALERTLAAMRGGADVIAQATLAQDRWLGRADVLLRVPRPSTLGDWSYEALDTKLAQETRGGAILQLCLYSELLAALQGVMPEHLYVVPRRPGFPLETYRVNDHLAYYRLVRRRLEAATGSDAAAATYPEPVAHCEICRWWPRCDRERRADDHLSLVAGISRLQTRELVSRDIGSLARLAEEPLPLAWRPSRGAKESYVRSREQARVQLAGRTSGHAVHELLALEPGAGLAALPEPSPGDLFLDFEGDPFVDDGGIEYLFGWVASDLAPAGMLPLDLGPPEYRATWALDRAAERRAFESLIDTILARWEAEPGMHVYHFSPYEPAAIKRLMGRYATRESEVDRLLRGGRFVDLHAVVRRSLRASVEEYSIKRLEALYGFERSQPLEGAGAALRVVQRALELGASHPATGEERAIVEAYNQDDCRSTLALRDWLETLRAGRVAAGEDIPRPADEAGEAPENVKETELRARALAAQLLEDVPELREERDDAQQGRWLLAHMLEFYRREEKAPWWEYFRLRDLSDEDLLDESAGLSGLEFVERTTDRRSVIDRYRFPAQETGIREGDKLRQLGPEGRGFGEVAAIDLAARIVDIRKGGSIADVHPAGVFKHDIVPTREQFESLMRFGAWVALHGITADGPYRAARDLLMRRPPRIADHAGGPLQASGETALDAARRLVRALDHGTLAIQGPPGSGKTHTGARMIVELVRAGKRVGVCAQSHKVIAHLLGKVVAAAPEAGMVIPCLQKVGEKKETPPAGITEVTGNAEAHAELEARFRVLGGTAWMWARPEFSESVDVLFIDEAGQMALPTVVAISQAARSVVLLGDSQQLEQPVQGSHPPGTAVSALQHVLGEDRRTIDPERGLFLAETWRLAPPICDFTSELFYERRLVPHAGLERQALLGETPFAGAGLWVVPVAHDANRSASAEEVEVVAELVRSLTAGGVSWRDREGHVHPLALEDVLVIAPFNAQVADLAARLPSGARVGTVDRFQGQEAPIVIYSMTTSTAADAPRGMEFLYSGNRFNVATSRARCACIVVGSPRLFEPDCQTPQQIRLANAFCRYLELAREVRIEPPIPAPGAFV